MWGEYIERLGLPREIVSDLGSEEKGALTVKIHFPEINCWKKNRSPVKEMAIEKKLEFMSNATQDHDDLR